ncbi:MAG: NAD(+)/NADH kinase [Myxococcota bacterium]
MQTGGAMATRPEVIVVYKRSKLALYVHEKRNPRVRQLLEEGAPIVETLQPAHEAHAATLALVKSVLRTRGVPYRMCYRGRLRREDTEGRLVITVGGDGTLLDASHRIGEAPVLGVNSDPAHSVGFLCAANSETFAPLLDGILRGELAPLTVSRLVGAIDGAPIPFPVLNEILVAHKNPAATVRYRIEARGRTEQHKSSGIWIAAPAGTTAAIASAGGSVQPIDDDKWQLLVREPYLADGPAGSLHHLYLTPDEGLRVTSRMPEGVIYLDGPHVRLPFPLGTTLEVRGDATPLSLYVTPHMIERRARLRHRRLDGQSP